MSTIDFVAVLLSVSVCVGVVVVVVVNYLSLFVVVVVLSSLPAAVHFCTGPNRLRCATVFTHR